MATVEITQNAIQYLADELHMEDEDAEELLSIAISLCRVRDSQLTMRAPDLAKAEPKCECGGKYFHEGCKLVYQNPPSG